MDILTPASLWRQFSAALDSFEGALRACPDHLWQARLWRDQPDQWVMPGFSSFWYLCYHTLFWNDLYLTGAEEGFSPPAPFDLVEMVDGETLPRVYSREELLGYLALVRRRTQDALEGMTPAQAQRLCAFPWGTVPYGELMVYVLRHVAEHAAQLHLFLSWQADAGAGRPPAA